MGIFLDPRRNPGETRAMYARRRAPWLTLAAMGCTFYVFYKPNPPGSAWLAMGLVWVAAVMAIVAADWSDLRK